MIEFVTIHVSCALAAPIDRLTTRSFDVVGLDFEIQVQAANETLVMWSSEYPTPLKNVANYYIAYLNFVSHNQTIGVDIDTANLRMSDVSLTGK